MPSAQGDGVPWKENSKRRSGSREAAICTHDIARLGGAKVLQEETRVRSAANAGQEGKIRLVGRWAQPKRALVAAPGDQIRLAGNDAPRTGHGMRPSAKRRATLTARLFAESSPACAFLRGTVRFGVARPPCASKYALTLSMLRSDLVVSEKASPSFKEPLGGSS